MAKTIFINVLCVFFFCTLACQKGSQIEKITSPIPNSVTPAITTYKVELTIPNLTPSQLASAIEGSISGSVAFLKDGVEHIILSPTLFFNEPLVAAVHLIKKNDSWIVEGIYNEGAMGAGRNYAFIDDATIAFADHGLELTQGTWPFGNILVAKLQGDKLEWVKVSSDRSFYHSVSAGDINGDKRPDIIGLHMGTKGSWTNDNLHTYLNNSDDSWIENRNIISLEGWGGKRGAGAVLCADVLGDSRAEIIRADYGSNPKFPTERYSIAIFQYTDKGRYQMITSPISLGVFQNPDRGATSMKAGDIDGDGDIDLLVAVEGTDYNGIEVIKNDGAGAFSPEPKRIEFSFTQMQFREFELIDVDSDKDLDVVLQPFHFGKLFRVAGNGYNKGTGITTDNIVFLNENGSFSVRGKGLTTTAVNPAYLKYMKGTKKMIGVEANQNGVLTIAEIPF